MQIKLSRKEGIRISTWINDKPISSSNWEVYSDNTKDNSILIVQQEPGTNNQLKIQIDKITNYENTEENKPENI
jgi:hypothetical protein